MDEEHRVTKNATVIVTTPNKRFDTDPKQRRGAALFRAGQSRCSAALRATERGELSRCPAALRAAEQSLKLTPLRGFALVSPSSQLRCASGLTRVQLSPPV